jgi:hypothetical protein
MTQSAELRARSQWLLDCLAQHGGRPAAPRNEPRSESDWTDMVAMATRHGVAPLLYQRLTREGSAPPAPGHVLQALREDFLMHGARNALFYQELGLVLRTLEQNHIPVIVLKGAHLAALAYEQIALRPMNDLDLLVHRADLERTASTLRDLGYVAEEEAEDLEAWCQEHAHLPGMLKPPWTAIEVHWTLLPPGRLRTIPIADLWARSRPATVAGAATRVLSPEDLLLHLCLHAASHEPDGPFGLGLRPLCDIAATIRRWGDAISWPQVQSRAREWRAGRCVFMTLWLAKELLAVAVPPSVTESLCPRGFDARWADLAVAQTLEAPERPPEDLASMPAPLAGLARRFRSGPRRSKLGVLLEAAFPSRAYMARYMARHHSVSLRGLRNYLCYATRALDWVRKGARWAWHWTFHRARTVAGARQLRRQTRFWDWLVLEEGRNSHLEAIAPPVAPKPCAREARGTPRQARGDCAAGASPK